MTLDIEFETLELPNGFKAYLKKTDSKLVSAKLMVYHGALNEQPGEEGLAHLLEHCILAGGTKHFPAEKTMIHADEFNSFNLGTNLDKTSIPANFLSTQLEDYLYFSSDIVFNPQLRAQEVEEERQAVLNEIADSNTIIYRKEKKEFEQAFWGKNSPFTYPVVGKREVIENVTTEQLRAFHDRGYVSNNMSLYLAGNIDDKVKDLITTYFGPGQSGEANRHFFKKKAPLQEQYIQIIPAPEFLNGGRPEEVSAYFEMRLDAPAYIEKDSPTYMILSSILGGTISSRLKQNIRKKRGLAYEVSSGYQIGNGQGADKITGNARAINLSQAIDGIFEEFQRLKEDLVSPEELQRHMNKSLYFALFSTESNSEVLDLMNLNVEYAWSHDENMRKLQEVTPEEIRRVANTYFPTQEDGNYALLMIDPLAKR